MDNQVENSVDPNMELLPAWATPLILAFMLSAAYVGHGSDKKPTQAVTPKAKCELLAATRECK